MRTKILGAATCVAITSLLFSQIAGVNAQPLDPWKAYSNVWSGIITTKDVGIKQMKLEYRDVLCQTRRKGDLTTKTSEEKAWERACSAAFDVAIAGRELERAIAKAKVAAADPAIPLLVRTQVENQLFPNNEYNKLNEATDSKFNKIVRYFSMSKPPVSMR